MPLRVALGVAAAALCLLLLFSPAGECRCCGRGTGGAGGEARGQKTRADCCERAALARSATCHALAAAGHACRCSALRDGGPRNGYLPSGARGPPLPASGGGRLVPHREKNEEAHKNCTPRPLTTTTHCLIACSRGACPEGCQAGAWGRARHLCARQALRAACLTRAALPLRPSGIHSRCRTTRRCASSCETLTRWTAPGACSTGEPRSS